MLWESLEHVQTATIWDCGGAGERAARVCLVTNQPVQTAPSFTPTFIPDIALSVSNASSVVDTLTDVFGGQVCAQSSAETRIELSGLVLNLEHVDSAVSTVWLTVNIAPAHMDRTKETLAERNCTLHDVSDPVGGVLCNTGHGLGFLLDPS